MVTLVSLLICLGAGGVGIPAYLTSTRVVDDMWRDLSQQISHGTVQRTIRYLEPAVPYAAMTRNLVELEGLDPGNEMVMLSHFRAAVEANPNFTWASYATTEGTYLAAYRNERQEIFATWRSQTDVGEDGEEGTRWREFRPGDSRGEWITTRDDDASYDPRVRPWYQEAVRSQDPTWVAPFLFFTRRQPGFMYTMPYRPHGTLRGVFAVEYEISYLSEFLSTLRVGRNGRVYIVTHDGLVVGHPEGQVTEGEGDELRIARAATHPDPLLSGAWRALQDMPTSNGAGARHQGRFSFGDQLGMIETFPEESGIPWDVIVVAPESDFFGTVREQARMAIAIALVLLVIAVFIGVLFSRRISAALRTIAAELDLVGRFKLSGKTLTVTNSMVREVNEMAVVTERMKKSLRSFGRYVPRALVGQLLASGQEAVLGGRKRELTVLFSDIAGFASIAEQLTPDELVAALGEYLDAMGAEIRQEDGTVDKFIGDAIMAFWGAPVEQTEHALNACRGALGMQRRLLQLTADWEEQGRPAFHTRIGVNTGLMVVGNIGAPERMNYTVMGDPVNLASRLEALNKLYRTMILIGESTHRQVERALLTRPLDYVAVKGKAEVILVHELLGERGDDDDELLESIAAYGAALELYRGREFEKAAVAFDAAREAFGGDDGPSETMAERSRSYAETPPPEDWNGAFVQMSK